MHANMQWRKKKQKKFTGVINECLKARRTCERNNSWIKRRSLESVFPIFCLCKHPHSNKHPLNKNFPYSNKRPCSVSVVVLLEYICNKINRGPWWSSSPSGTRECTVPSNRSRRKILGRLLSAISQKKEISARSSLSALFPISALPQRYQKSLMGGFDKHYQNKTRMLPPPHPPLER